MCMCLKLMQFQVKTVVFDKTGTITRGKPEMNKICLLTPQSVCPLPWLLAIFGTAESNSEHPIGSAIVEFAKKFLRTSTFGQCKDFESLSGFGIRCKVSNVDQTLMESCAAENQLNGLKNSIKNSIRINEVEISQNKFNINGN